VESTDQAQTSAPIDLPWTRWPDQPSRVFGWVMLVVGFLFAVLEKPFADPSRHVGWAGTLATFIVASSVVMKGWRRISHHVIVAGDGFSVIGTFYVHRVPWGELKPVQRRESKLLLTIRHRDREMFFPVGPFAGVGELHELMNGLRQRAQERPDEASTRTLRWSSVALAGGLVVTLIITLTLGHRWGQSFW